MFSVATDFYAYVGSYNLHIYKFPVIWEMNDEDWPDFVTHWLSIPSNFVTKKQANESGQSHNIIETINKKGRFKLKWSNMKTSTEF